MLPSASVILHRALHLKDVMHMGVQIPSQTADGVEVVHVNTASVGVVQVVPYVKIDDLTQHKAVRATSDGENLDQPTLHINGRIRDAWRCDLHAGDGRQARQGEFIDVFYPQPA